MARRLLYEAGAKKKSVSFCQAICTIHGSFRYVGRAVSTANAGGMHRGPIDGFRCAGCARIVATLKAIELMVTDLLML